MCEGQWAASLQAVRTTQSPIGFIRPVSSASGIKSTGEIIPRCGMSPSDQRFDAGHLPGLDVDDGMIVQLELFVRQRVAQLDLVGAACARLHAHSILEKSVGVAALGLRLIEREIGVFHQLIHVRAVFGRQRDADTGADIDDDGRRDRKAPPRLPEACWPSRLQLRADRRPPSPRWRIRRRRAAPPYRFRECTPTTGPPLLSAVRRRPDARANR